MTAIENAVFKMCDKLTSIYIYNDNIDISNSENTIGDKNITTIYAHKGSAAEVYANQYGYQFKELLLDTKPL